MQGGRGAHRANSGGDEQPVARARAQFGSGGEGEEENSQTESVDFHVACLCCVMSSRVKVEYKLKWDGCSVLRGPVECLTELGCFVPKQPAEESLLPMFSKSIIWRQEQDDDWLVVLEGRLTSVWQTAPVRLAIRSYDCTSPDRLPPLSVEGTTSVTPSRLDGGRILWRFEVPSSYLAGEGSAGLVIEIKAGSTSQTRPSLRAVPPSPSSQTSAPIVNSKLGSTK